MRPLQIHERVATETKTIIVYIISCTIATDEKHGGNQDEMHLYNKLGLGQWKEPKRLEALDAQTAQQ